MSNKIVFKIADFVVFAFLAYWAYRYYVVNPHIFDAVNIAALVYVIVRRPDVNTVSLAFIILAGRILDSMLLYDIESLGGFVAYPVLLVFNVVGVLIIWIRPVIASKYGPFKGNDNFAVTNQDDVLSMLLTVQGVFMLLMTIEHATRKINIWWFENSRMLYNNYEIIQFCFAIIGVMILYFMTFDASKIKRAHRKKFRIQDGLQ